MSTCVYRGYQIYFDPKPVPITLAGCWTFVHDDYDGAPDANDHRCGDGVDVPDCKRLIDEMIEDLEAA